MSEKAIGQVGLEINPGLFLLRAPCHLQGIQTHPIWLKRQDRVLQRSANPEGSGLASKDPGSWVIGFIIAAHAIVIRYDHTTATLSTEQQVRRKENWGQVQPCPSVALWASVA